ncbi:MAG: hypothetical protein ACJAT1_002197 [Marivirga sp.]|jgi:hypothetical protein
MKTITVKTSSKENETIIFVDNINYIKERNSSEVMINFRIDCNIVSKISISEITNKINAQ